MGTDIISQIMTRPGLTISITSEELLSFSRSIIQEAEARIKKANDAKANEVWLSSAEARAKIGVSVATLSRWAKRGKLHPKRLGAALLFSEAEILAVINGRQ